MQFVIVLINKHDDDDDDDDDAIKQHYNTVNWPTDAKIIIIIIFFLPSVVKIPRVKSKAKSKRMMERLEVILRGCVLLLLLLLLLLLTTFWA